MKTKTIVVFLLILCKLNLYSQSGQIIYEAEMRMGNLNDIREAKISKKTKSLLLLTFKNQEKVKYNLEFNKKESIFKKVEKLKIDKNIFNIAENKIKGIFYTNKKSKKILHQKESFDQLFLITVPQFNWKLSQESKKIGEYICYKATTTKDIESRRGKSTIKITAWYTTKIPFNYGPKDYNGLPGLILELQEGELLIKSSLISLFPKKECKIKQPIKGKKVTLKEFDSIVKKIVLSSKR